MANERILVMNPGSTSTKIAVYEEDKPLFTESIVHTEEEIAPFEHVVDQYEFRRDVIMKCLKEHDITIDSLSAVVSRGGLLAEIHAGAYEVGDDMIWQLKNNPRNEHASNVGALIAKAISDEAHIPAFIYDGVTVDELLPINRITGLPELHRKGMGHNLNTRAAAMRYARENGKNYSDITVIVAHLGGGISVNLHERGRIADFISDEEGPFSPERAGGLPMFDVIRMCFSGDYTYDSMMRLVKNQGGLMAHLKTKDAIEVEKRIKEGDAKAELVYDAMALNIAKNIGKIVPGVTTPIDAVILTGGISYSEMFTGMIKKRVEYIAPVVVYPGEDEMDALARGCLRVLRGEEKARQYEKKQI